MSDILSSIKDALKERISNPLLTSFMIAWVIWNYRFIVILISDTSINDTFALIDDIFPTYSTIFFKGFFYPLISAVIYIFAYPYPAKLVYEFWYKKQKELFKIKQKIEDETPLTLEQSKQIRQEFYTKESNLNDELERKEAQIERLKKMLAENETQAYLPRIKSSNKKTFSPSKTQFEYLKYIASQDAGVEADFINKKNLSTDDKIRADFDIGELLSKNLIKKDFSNFFRGLAYTITHEGRKAIVDYESANNGFDNS